MPTIMTLYHTLNSSLLCKVKIKKNIIVVRTTTFQVILLFNLIKLNYLFNIIILPYWWNIFFSQSYCLLPKQMKTITRALLLPIPGDMEFWVVWESLPSDFLLPSLWFHLESVSAMKPSRLLDFCWVPSDVELFLVMLLFTSYHQHSVMQRLIPILQLSLSLLQSLSWFSWTESSQNVEFLMKWKSLRMKKNLAKRMKTKRYKMRALTRLIMLRHQESKLKRLKLKELQVRVTQKLAVEWREKDLLVIWWSFLNWFIFYWVE